MIREGAEERLLGEESKNRFGVAEKGVINGRDAHARDGSNEEEGEDDGLLPVRRDEPDVVYV